VLIMQYGAARQKAAPVALVARACVSIPGHQLEAAAGMWDMKWIWAAQALLRCHADAPRRKRG